MGFSQDLSDCIKEPLYTVLPRAEIKKRIVSCSFFLWGEYLDEGKVYTYIEEVQEASLEMVAKVEILRERAVSCGIITTYLDSLVNVIRDHFPYIPDPSKEFPLSCPPFYGLNEVDKYLDELMAYENRMRELSRLIKSYFSDELNNLSQG